MDHFCQKRFQRPLQRLELRFVLPFTGTERISELRQGLDTPELGPGVSGLRLSQHLP